MAAPRVAVVGGGLAGLMTTIKLAEAGVPVDLFSIVPVKRSHSVCAQGGINGAVNVKGEELYTRSGSFNLDSTLTLVDGSGGRVQGWMADNAGQLDSVGAVRDINLSEYQSVPAQAATSMKVRGSLSVSTNVGTVIDSLAKVVDGLGIENTVSVTITARFSSGEIFP